MPETPASAAREEIRVLFAPTAQKEDYSNPDR